MIRDWRWPGFTPAAQGSTLSFRHSFCAMLGVSLVIMLSSLDQTIIGNALPAIVAELDGFRLYAWAATSYLLCSMVSIPIFGRMGDYFGRKPFVLLSTVVFMLASVACAKADSMIALVLGRAMQGIGGGMIIGSAFACIPELFPDTRRRLRWQIILSTASSVANATGPLLGGILTSTLGWRSIFLINIPFGLLALACAWRFIPYYPPKHDHKIRVDWGGAVLTVSTLAGLQLFLDRLPHADWLWLPLLGALTLVSGLLLYRCERTSPDALLPPHIFGTDALRRLFLMAILTGAIMYVLLFYLPLLFQGGFGISPKEAGILVTPLALLMTIGAIINGRIMTRVSNPNFLLFGGVGALVVCSLGFAMVGKAATFGQLLSLTIVGGFGLGFTMLTLTVFTQTLSPDAYIGIATAMQKSLRLVGGMLGAAAMSALLSWLYHCRITTTFDGLGYRDAVAIFSDPQILMPGNSKELSRLPGPMVQQARDVLRETLSVGFWLLSSVGVWALLIFRRVPKIALN